MFGFEFILQLQHTKKQLVLIKIHILQILGAKLFNSESWIFQIDEKDSQIWGVGSELIFVNVREVWINKVEF